MMYSPPKRPQGHGSTRVQRKFQILTILYDRAEQEKDFTEKRGWDAGGFMTTGQIARSMKMSQSPHLRGLLDELLGEGAIVVKAIDWRPNMQAYAWRINLNTRYSQDWKAAFDAWENPEQALS